MNEELKTIFGDGIVVDGAAFPIAHLRYKGESKRFGTWTMLAERPVLNGDDEPLYSVASVDVDVYCDGNYLNAITVIKKLMKDNGWVWVEDSVEMYEEDTELYHKTSTFEKERAL